jgi:hypothetical protein
MICLKIKYKYFYIVIQYGRFFRGVYHRPLGGISPTFCSVGNFVDRFVDKNGLGGISPTFGGYITDLWGVYHRPLGGISPTKRGQKL